LRRPASVAVRPRRGPPLRPALPPPPPPQEAGGVNRVQGWWALRSRRTNGSPRCSFLHGTGPGQGERSCRDCPAPHPSSPRRGKKGPVPFRGGYLAMHELVVRINGTHAAFTALG